MSVPQEGAWLDVVDIDADAGMRSHEGLIFVDFGGGFVQQCARWVERYPHVEGRLILQDKDETIAITPSMQGVDAMAYDFFTPQVVKSEHLHATFHLFLAALHPSLPD
jgi:hypothetical protein